MAFERYNNTATDKFGNGLAAASVAVYRQTDYGVPSSTLATLYSTSTGTALANPFTADTLGNYDFYAAAGVYTVTVTHNGISFTDTDVVLGVTFLYDGSSSNLVAAAASNSSASSAPAAGTFLSARNFSLANGTVSNSSISTTPLAVSRTDNSPPVSGAGILNGWLSPMARFRLISQSGTVTGSHMAALFDMLSVKGKTWTTTGQVITASGSPQTVLVGDSSVFGTVSPDNQASIDPGQGSANTETVSVTAIPDATHITAIFSKNHTSGARIGVSGRGYKSVVGFALDDQAGSTNELNVINPNLIVNGSGIQAVCTESDLTTNVVPGNYFGDRTGPWSVAYSALNAGSQNSSVAYFAGTSNGATNFRVGAELTGSVVGVIIENSGGGSPTNGLAIQSAATNGIIIGSDQPTLTNPNFTKADPTRGIVLTAKGTAANASSNTLEYESYDAGAAKHIYLWQHGGNAKRLDLSYDGVSLGTGFNFDGSIQTQNQYQVRDSGTNTTRGKFEVSGTTSLITSDVFKTNGTVASSGDIRLQNASVINWRNNGNSANVSLAKDTSDRLTFAGNFVASTPSVLISPTAPTIASGFGTSPSVTASNGTAVIIVNVGTGGVATSGVITMPAATNGWTCVVNNITAAAGHRADNTVQTASTTTSITIENQTKSTGAAVAWTASDIVRIIAFAY
jgi:hypothetical protein